MSCILLKLSISFNNLGLFFYLITVYIFDPRSAIPLAVQTNVVRSSNFLAASFQPNMKGLTVQNKADDVTMSRLFYMDSNQVAKNPYFSIKCSCFNSALQHSTT